MKMSPCLNVQLFGSELSLYLLSLCWSQEMQCLQDHLDELTPDCEEAVGNFTEDEDEDVSLDRILMKECAPMMKRFCEVRS